MTVYRVLCGLTFYQSGRFKRRRAELENR